MVSTLHRWFATHRGPLRVAFKCDERLRSTSYPLPSSWTPFGERGLGVAGPRLPRRVVHCPESRGDQ
jgi:hypothetical protein